ncbi:MAG: hypothetical protein WBD02_09010 [Acidimicrobiia bacterium]
MKYAEYVIAGWGLSTAIIGLYWAKQRRALRAIEHASRETQGNSGAEL